MGAAVIIANPFRPEEAKTLRVKRVQTIGRFVRRHQRRQTMVREIDGRRLRVFTRPTVCLLNGRPVLRADWSKTWIGAHDVVTFQAIPPRPSGGGGSNPIGVILAIAVAVAVPILGPMLGTALGFAAGSLGMSLVTAGVGIALSAVAYGIMSLFVQPPPPAAPMAQASYGGVASSAGAASSPTYSLQAQGNVARLGQPIPELVGRHQIFPDFIAEPYARYVDNKQYLHHLLGVTIGRLEIEELRLGDTPISSFASIEWQQVEPGEAVDPDICDPRMLLCRDLAQVELPASNDPDEPSAWKGPFAANPSGTVIDHLEIDTAATQGLWKFNTGTGGLDAKSATFEVEAREIDDDGDPVGAGTWTPLDTITKTATSRSPVRWTDGLATPSAGRWEVRLRRTDAKDGDIQAGHQLDWIGMRGRTVSGRTWAGMTVLAVKILADGDVNGQSSRRLNLIGTRLLPTWDAEGEAMDDEALVATRNPCDVFAHIARTPNGGRLADSQVDLAGLYADRATFDEDGWTFDFVFDQAQTTFEALSKVGRAVIGQVIPQGGRVHLVRDVPKGDVPVMMFGMHNIRAGSLKIEYKMVDEQTADALVGSYMDTRSWKPATVTVANDDSPQDNPSNINLHGVTNRAQARAGLYNWLRGNDYRRRIVTFETEMEGAMLRFAAPISLTHDLARWGQSAEIVEWNAGDRIARLSEPLEFTDGATHYVRLRDNVGCWSAQIAAAAIEGDAYGIQLGAGTLPEILTGGDRERTWLQFGPGQAYSKRLLVNGIKPLTGGAYARVVAIDDDPRMHDPVPEEDVATPPIGAPPDPLDLHVTANTANLNLRAFANAHGFTGNPAQSVTITIDPGVVIYATGTGQAALIRGSWPGGYKPKLVVSAGATIDGAGGIGGAFSAGGAPGGAALDASSGPLEIDNGGAFRGGGGGGGGGGNSGHKAAGGGGGGQGRNNPAGGAPYTGTGTPGNAGGAGSAAGPGGGGQGVDEAVYEQVGIDPDTGQAILIFDHDCSGGDGGGGGAWGQAGQPGTNGSPDFGAGYGNGGAAGYAVLGNANITWINTGTRIGPIS